MSRAREDDPRSTCGLKPSARATVWLAVLALASFAPAARAGVSAALEPATQTVTAGADFDVTLTVTESGSVFNAFDAVVGHDPAALTLIQLTPISLQEGALMQEGCASRFHRFRSGSDRDTITDVLLCSGVSLSGPGQIYRLRFHASSTPQTTTIQFLSGIRFYDAGVAVTPVTTADATVVIASPVGVGLEDVGRESPRLRVGPNPSRGATKILVETAASGSQELAVRDLMGRLVRRLPAGWFAAGRREVIWDGRDDAGARSRPGMYYAELRTPERTVRVPIVRVD